MGCGCSSKNSLGSKTRRTLYSNNPRTRQQLRRMRVEHANRIYLRQAPIFTLMSTYRKDASYTHLSVTIFSYLSFPEAVLISGVSRQVRYSHLREFYKLTGSKQILSLYGGVVMRDTQRSVPRFGANILIINTNQVFLNRGDSQVVQLVSPTYLDHRDILEKGDHVQFENEFFRKSLLSLGRSSLNTAQFYGHENEQFASNRVAKKIGGLSLRSGEGLTSIVSSLDIANISTPKSNNARRGSKFSGKSADQQYHSEQSLRGKMGVADSGLSFRFDFKHNEERQHVHRVSHQSRFAFENSPRHLPQFAGQEQEDKEY